MASTAERASVEPILELHREPFTCFVRSSLRAEAEALLARDRTRPGVEAELDAQLDAILDAPALPSRSTRGRAQQATLPRATAPGSLHFKPVRHGGWLAPLWTGRVASPARARRELAVADHLFRAGAPVTEPVLVLARRARPLWRVALASVYIEGSEDGASALARCAPDARDELLHACGAALRRFHAAGGRHADLHLGNFLIADSRVWIVDLDRARAAQPLRGGDPPELARLRRSLSKHGLLGGLPAFEAGYRDTCV